MFSTVDARRVTVTRIDPEGERALGIPEEFEDAADRCEGLPTEGCLRDLATAIAARPEQGGGALRVEVWETHFDRDMRPVPRRLRAVTVHGLPVSR